MLYDLIIRRLTGFFYKVTALEGLEQLDAFNFGTVLCVIAISEQRSWNIHNMKLPHQGPTNFSYPIDK